MSKKTWIILGASALLVILLYNLFAGKYNRMVVLDEEVREKWSNVETQYQRRADLIPNLVEVVKGYAKHEKEVFTAVTEARAKATSVTVDPSNLTPQAIQNFQKLQSGLSSALSRLLAVAERYPDLKANTNFLELQAQLEGTENRISVARNRFNQAVKEFNTYIRKFPNNMLASMYGFEKKVPFEADEGTEKAPNLKGAFD